MMADQSWERNFGAESCTFRVLTGKINGKLMQGWLASTDFSWGIFCQFLPYTVYDWGFMV